MNLKPRKIEFHLGLEQSVRILHLTDAHLAFADERDREGMIEYSAKARSIFFNEAGCPERDPVGFLEEAAEYAKEFDCTVITGDLVDFNTYKNYETAQRILAGRDYLFCAGNHEFTPKPGIDSYELKANSLEFVQSHFRGNLYFESRIVGGVNVVSADNGYYTWTEDQLELLKAEAAKGLPILLFTHVPIHPHLMDPAWFQVHAKIPGFTEEMFQTSAKVMRYLAEEPAFKGFCSGHWHNDSYIDFCGKPSYVLGGLFKGIVGDIKVV